MGSRGKSTVDEIIFEGNMTKDMVERVAEAMFDAQAPLTPWAECASKDWWRHVARAAIEAMLEPTEEMVNATDCGFGLGDWKAMVLAALKEEP